MSLLDVPYLIEVPPKQSAYCHKIVATPQNRSIIVNALAPGASNTNFTQSMHKYIVQALHVLLGIIVPAMTTWLTNDGLAGHRSCLNNHAAVTHYKRPS